MIRFLGIVLIASFTQTGFADICGHHDRRVLSEDPKVGRLGKQTEHKGCTLVLVGNKCALTAGSCLKIADKVEFNTPLSIGGIPQPSREEDRYQVNKQTWDFNYGSIGKEWAVIELKKNEITGKYPGEVQGFYKVASHKPKKQDSIRVVSYASDDNYEFPDSESGIKNYAQQTSVGTVTKAGIFLLPTILEFDADTSWGGLGAPVINEATDEVIGISTHGGCKTVAGKGNSGTLLYKFKQIQTALKACLSR